MSACIADALLSCRRILQVKGVDQAPVVFTRPYLRHNVSGHVITAQHKAWMDTPGMVLWADILLAPWKAKVSSAGELAMVWDNCGPHSVKVVLDTFNAYGINPLALPPNVTDDLQPMDLHVNGGLKQEIRRERSAGLLKYFHGWKLKATEAKASQELLCKQAVAAAHSAAIAAAPTLFDAAFVAPLPAPAAMEVFSLPAFAPPKPTLVDGLRLFFKAFKRMETDVFKAGLARSFKKVGLVEEVMSDGSLSYARYTGHKNAGYFNASVAPANAPEVFKIADFVCPIEMVTRREEEGSELEPEDVDDPEATINTFEFE